MQLYKPHPYIVLVDDDEDERYIMNHAFSRIGWAEHVKFFGTPEELFQYLKNLPDTSFPSLIVLDYNMPKINGMEALSFLKKHDAFRHIPVSVYSTSIPPGLKDKLFGVGAHSCHEKLFEIAGAIELAGTLKNIAQGIGVAG
ncbi:response regulator [Paraflavisolibacter sp. H34]|uniref:response regulator n=1 Tax=Huijunlia imazamoxiresistens TaxID=3127457 RepID=UPI00301AA5C7